MTYQTTKQEQNKRKHSPCIRLKVPAGLVAEATRNGYITPLKYYYAAKSFKSNGQFKRGELVEYLMAKSEKCKATIKKNIGKLIGLGWIRKSGTGYQVASYDTVWEMMDWDIDADHLGLIYFSPELFDLSMAVTIPELKLNQLRQTKAHEKKIICIESEISHTDLLSRSRACFKKLRRTALKSYDEAKYNEREQDQLRALESSCIDTDTQINCLTFAKLFGRRSASTGHKMQQKLKQAGLISVEYRKLNLKVRMTIPALRDSSSDSSFFIKNGFLFKQLPNKITIL